MQIIIFTKITILGLYLIRVLNMIDFLRKIIFLPIAEINQIFLIFFLMILIDSHLDTLKDLI